MSDTPIRCPNCRSDNVSPYHHEDEAKCHSCGQQFHVRQEARDLFHQNWTDAARGPWYKKRFWQRLAEILRF